MTIDRRSFFKYCSAFLLLPLTSRLGFASYCNKRELMVGVGALGREICEESKWIKVNRQIRVIQISDVADTENIDSSCQDENVLLLSSLDEGLLVQTICRLKSHRPEAIGAFVTRPYGCEGAKRRRMAEDNLAALKSLTANIEIVHSDPSRYRHFADANHEMPLHVIQNIDKKKLVRQLTRSMS